MPLYQVQNELIFLVTAICWRVSSSFQRINSCVLVVLTPFYAPVRKRLFVFIKASLKVRRSTMKCCAFDCRQEGMIKAHDADMRGVCKIGKRRDRLLFCFVMFSLFYCFVLSTPYPCSVSEGVYDEDKKQMSTPPERNPRDEFYLLLADQNEFVFSGYIWSKWGVVTSFNGGVAPLEPKDGYDHVRGRRRVSGLPLLKSMFPFRGDGVY